MQIVATIRKLLTAYTVEQILGHFAHELDDCAAHFETVGALHTFATRPKCFAK